MWFIKNSNVLAFSLASIILGALGCSDTESRTYSENRRAQPEEIQIEVVLKDKKEEVTSASEAPAATTTPMYQDTTAVAKTSMMANMANCDQRRDVSCAVTSQYAGAGYAGAPYAGAGIAGAPYAAGAVGAPLAGGLGLGLDAGIAPYGGMLPGLINPIGIPVGGPFFGPGFPFIVDDILLEDDYDRRDWDDDTSDDDSDDDAPIPVRRTRNR